MEAETDSNSGSISGDDDNDGHDDRRRRRRHWTLEEMENDLMDIDDDDEDDNNHNHDHDHEDDDDTNNKISNTNGHVTTTTTTTTVAASPATGASSSSAAVNLSKKGGRREEIQQPMQVVVDDDDDSFITKDDRNSKDNHAVAASNTSSSSTKDPQGQGQGRRPTMPLLDCYPYTFTPLLLFCQSSYFDKGYSNYNSVSQFFSNVIPPSINMLSNVIYERTNMLYEELLEHICQHQMLVTCCIDNHFTAFQVLHEDGKANKPCALYYDPCQSSCKLVREKDGLKTFCLFLLMKCHYGDSQHIQEHKDHYTGLGTNHTRRLIYSLWKKINQISNVRYLHGVTIRKISLSNLDKYYMINDQQQYHFMSTQLTSNTCYFQTYLFAVLCKVGNVTATTGGSSSSSSGGTTAIVQNLDLLERVTIQMCQYLLTFFVTTTTTIKESSAEVEDPADAVAAGMVLSSPDDEEGKHEDRRRQPLLRPLTNSNIVLDFYRYQQSPYYKVITQYLAQQQQQHNMSLEDDDNDDDVPSYELQYDAMMDYFWKTKLLHHYSQFTMDGNMASTTNSKQLQKVNAVDNADAYRKLARGDYYKFRPSNLMFGCNAGILRQFESFTDFQAWRKNQLLSFYPSIREAISGLAKILVTQQAPTKYRDYYFMPQFEVGQQELIDVHYYTTLLDLYAVMSVDKALSKRIHAVNAVLAQHIYFSTQKTANYEKFVSTEDFQRNKKLYKPFLESFLTTGYLQKFVGLGFAEINPKEKEINSLTQTVFYSYDLMRTQAHRQSYEFEKECINQMARSNIRAYARRFDDDIDRHQKYKISIRIGEGYTYTKYNTLMHFLSVAQRYWNNPDLSNTQVFGKDIRALLAISCQKIFFDESHKSGYYHYGPFEGAGGYRGDTSLDLAVSNVVGDVIPSVSRSKRSNLNALVITDRVFEFGYLKRILRSLFEGADGTRFKPDNEVLNLCLLSLMLDFGLYQQHHKLLNLPFLECLQHAADTKELQVEVANLIFEFDKNHTADNVTRSRVEELIFETSYKFLVNKDFSVQSRQFKLIRALNSDPDYQSYVLMCKIYLSLCQINKSVEVDYYKVHVDGEFRIIIPQNFSKTTSEYLDEITRQYTFSERNQMMLYDDLPVFDLRPHQPEIHLHKVRFDSGSRVQSVVKYIEISNVFRVVGNGTGNEKEQYLIFVADNVLLVENVSGQQGMTMRINKMAVEVATMFFNEAISFIPCFKYAESEDVVLFTSRNIHYLIPQGGQFCTDYYGMKHPLIECIKSTEIYTDLNDEHQFKSFKLSDLLTESKTVIYFPDYLLQVPSRQELINLLDLAIKIRNVSFFILVLLYLRRSSVLLEYIEREGDVVKITGPWKEAILYVLNKAGPNSHYNKIFKGQFFDLNQHQDAPLEEFIDILCDNFTKYQRFIDGAYQIIPTAKQKAFLKRIVCADHPLMFSEVGSGKTKVILPLLCQTFLSNNIEAHRNFARGGCEKNVLVILVPEHLVTDARAQVYRYCLNLNFRDEYRVYDDIFALLHHNCRLDTPMKQIFVASFNTFKKALTYDSICKKVWPRRENILVVADEVDDFLDRNKLVFNICSNKNNDFERPILDLFFEVSRAAYNQSGCPLSETVANPEYWAQLYKKFVAIHAEIQDASRSINKSFGIFNEYTLRHCATNISHDIEGYKALIARPYESVNRAMPGSYYSDVERTIYLTYVILTEDVAKYDGLFQAERKFITFEYWNTHFIHQLDFDDLVYGHETLSEIVEKHPGTKDGLARYLYEIILRRMEIRDKSRSVNSIDVIFNFDFIGFTGTPFLDNYPTFNYIRHGRKDDIPDLIDRSFYAYSCDNISAEEFENRFVQFQGQNSNVIVEYVSSDFVRDSPSEMATLEAIFAREEKAEGDGSTGFNAIVDLCGIFKQSTIHDVRNLILKHFGPDRFKFIYHVDAADSRDRVLCISTENDAPYDEEFYNHMCKGYDANLRDRIFFFIDNRNVIGKDVPFQLIYQRHFNQPLFVKSVVLAHDVDDFSRIWQGMGRSRTMNHTRFSIYKSGIPSGLVSNAGADDIKKHEFTRHLYVHNCDTKVAGNISSIYLTLIALYNLSQNSFYHCGEIVNAFLDKMEKTIDSKVLKHERQLVHRVLGSSVPARILFHILKDKFNKSSNQIVATAQLTEERVEALLRHIVKQKYEQRVPSGDAFDDFIVFLSGEQRSLMEISYTKQQQKQKQKQQNKNQNSDAMGVFDKRNQLRLQFGTDDYFRFSKSSAEDLTKVFLSLPCSTPIMTVSYKVGSMKQRIDVYPTVQFLYSHHILGTYISPGVREDVNSFNGDLAAFHARFLQTAESRANQKLAVDSNMGDEQKQRNASDLEIQVVHSFIRQNPHYTLAGLKQGVYLIGMKEQFTKYDIAKNEQQKERQNLPILYTSDEIGLILYDKTGSRNVDSFGPYCIEQYILLDILSKQEVAQNVIDYYCHHKETLQDALDTYDERQGKGFVCWRFLMNETAKAASAAAASLTQAPAAADDQNGGIEAKRIKR